MYMKPVKVFKIFKTAYSTVEDPVLTIEKQAQFKIK